MTQPNATNQPAKELSACDVINYILATSQGKIPIPKILSHDDMSQVGAVEAYAAQQTATLQAKVSELEAEVERYKLDLETKSEWLKECHEENSALRNTTGEEWRLEKLSLEEKLSRQKAEISRLSQGSLQTENEQLHAKLAMLREAIAKRLSQPEAPGFPLIDAYKATEADVDQWLKTKISDAVLDSKVVTGKKFAMENEFYRQVGNI